MPENKTEKEYHATPYDFFKSTSHEVITHDASYQLLQPGESVREILSKTNLPDQDFLNRVAQCIAKLEECGLGEDAKPPYNSAINMVKNVLIGLNSLEGNSRAEFIQALGRLFAPGFYELKKTGKISAEGAKPKKHLGILKSREEKQEEQQ